MEAILNLPTWMLTTGGVVVLVVLGIMALLAIARMYHKVGPNEALVAYGMGGTKVVIGSGAFIVPLIKEARTLSLELMSFDVAPQTELYTNQGVAVLIESVTQLKVKSDLESVKTAAEQFLDKPEAEREAAIKLVMEGHLRGIVGQLTVEQIVKDPEGVGDKVRSTCAGDLSKMGLEMVSFTIKQVRDKNEYIRNMGIPDIEKVKKEANIAAAEAARDTDIKRAQAVREAEIAKAQADQERVIAQTASQAKQAEAQRDLEIKKAQYAQTVQNQRAQADKAYEIQANIMQQQVVTEKIKIDQVERIEQIKVQEAEIARREKELIATQLKPAQVEAQRITTMAEAEKTKLRVEAEGRSEAIRKQGEAEAYVIQAKGEAEASAMDVKAKAYAQYNQAAVLDKLFAGLPEVVRAIADPLRAVDKITVISTGGDGAKAGVSKITGDVANIVAQVPTLVESLSGISIGDFLKNLPQIGKAMRAADSELPEVSAVEVKPAPPVAGHAVPKPLSDLPGKPHDLKK